jgi:DNA-binding Lrp family transcriptional regulator
MERVAVVSCIKLAAVRRSSRFAEHYSIPTPMRPLDRTDCALVRLLQNNARMSNKEVAAALGVAPSTALERTRRLEASGVLRGYHARLDPAHVGVGVQALVSVRLRRHAREVVESFLDHARALPEVVQVFHTTGAADALVHVAARDPEHLRELALVAFTERPEVARIETSLLFAHHAGSGLPIYAESGGA